MKRAWGVATLIFVLAVAVVAMAANPFISPAYDRIQADVSWLAGQFLALTGGNVTGPIGAANGSAAAPSFGFTANPNTGMYAPSGGQVGIAANGQLTITFAKDTGAFPIIGIGTAPVTAQTFT